jgi:CubicO group peptidase (beta-lactamase class C family)
MDRRQLLTGAACACLAACERKPTMSAFRDDGLKTLQASLNRHVGPGAAPGLVALVERNGERHAFALGKMSREPDAAPVPRDAIFRLASMTKPITAAAAMMLVEDGKLRLDEPVDRLAPELANRRVLRSLDAALDDTVPASRPITLEDVLSFRLGWGVQFDPDLPISQATAELPGFGMPNPASPLTPDAFMAELGKLPLMAQPGERWLYTAGSNVLGVLVARAAGKPLDAVFEERILGPLGMKDTAFWVPPEKAGRLITGYMPQEGGLAPFEPWNGLYGKPPAFPAGDSGLVSTADDYAAFARFLHTGLAPDGRRLLSEATLAAMRTDRLTPEQRKGGAEILGPYRGWAYVGGVYAQTSPEGVPAGAYGWGGGFGTSWFNDPATGLTAILLTQRVFDGPDEPQAHKDFWEAACAAVA